MFVDKGQLQKTSCHFNGTHWSYFVEGNSEPTAEGLSDDLLLVVY